MGQIRLDVRQSHLDNYPTEEKLLNPFLNDFNITWGKRRRQFGTDFSVYFLSPERHIEEQFGFESEIILIVSTYPTLQPRTFQAVEQVMSDSPAKGRVNQSIFFLVTELSTAKDWINGYLMENPQARVPVAFVRNNLILNAGNSWYIRNEIMDQLFTRDLFNFQLPIDNDLSFFGRDALVAEFADSIRQSQNRGLFGLRKTGKTSFLFKVMRQARRDGGTLIYFDCKNPGIRNQNWIQLLNRICDEMKNITGKKIRRDLENLHISDKFISLLKQTPNKSRVCIIFDEIEYISPNAKMDIHWHEEFVPFWQTLWTAQSQLRRLSFIVAGVNPSIVEQNSVSGIQNPMFGIVSPRYLRGFEFEELKTMVRTIGRRMGLKFSDGAMNYMFRRYGGHPLLTRMACSHVHNVISSERLDRPIQITEGLLSGGEEQREEEISFYSGHVVSELREFYPDEYELLEALASGNIAEYLEYSTALPEFTRHLRDYGLVESSEEGRPSIKISVVGKYVSYELARENRTRNVRYVIPIENRESWIKLRLKSIQGELANLVMIIASQELPKLYGQDGFAEQDRFLGIEVVEDEAGFLNFINTCNRSLVESLVNRSLFESLKESYPDLWDALNRIRAYRNFQSHLILNERAKADLQLYLEQDLNGLRLTQVEDGYFVLQQSVIDQLFAALIFEINRHT